MMDETTQIRALQLAIDAIKEKYNIPSGEIGKILQSSLNEIQTGTK